MAILKRSIALFCLFAACAAFAGCHTVEGVGKDVQSGGKAIENAGH